MIHVEWTDTARDDLRAIHAYIARDSRQYAKGIVDRIKEKVEGILFPESCAMVPEWDRPDVRETFVTRYRVIFRIIEEDLIEIITVIDGARLLPDHSNLIAD